MKPILIQEYERKDKQFNFRLSTTEYETISELCKTHSLSTGEFMRKCINEYAANHYSDYCKARVIV